MLALKIAKRIAIAVIGGTVVLIGVIMLVTPGPAFVVIPAGLAILAIEFSWARRWLQRAREFIQKSKNRANGGSETAAPATAQTESNPGSQKTDSQNTPS